MDSRFPFLVVDHNSLRQDERREDDLLKTAIDRCCRESLQILLPEGAFFELSKGSRPLDTWRRSLSFLAKYRELVSVSRKLSVLRQEEIVSGQPCSSISADDLTEFHRSLLESLAANDSRALTELVDGPIASLMPASIREFGDA